MEKTAQFNGNVSEIETTKNKTLSIDENSTDAQYPSAKAVYAFTKSDPSKVGKKTAKGGEVFNDYEHNEASGLRSSVRNYGNKASGNDATAGGHHTVASGWASDSNGRDTEASGDQATSRGRKTVAEGNQSTSEGWETRALGTASKAQGIRTIAQADKGAFAHGGYGGAYNYQTESGGYGCLAVGCNSSAKGHSTLALGYTTNTHGRETVAGMSGWGVECIVRGSEPNTLELFLYDEQPNNEIAPEDCLKPGTVDNKGEQFYDISAFDGKKSVDSFYEGIENGTITELPVLFYKGESILIKGCSVLKDNQTSAKHLLVEIDDISKISEDDFCDNVSLKADNATWSELPTETNLLKTATLENIGIVDGEETEFKKNSGINGIIDEKLSVWAQWQLSENSNSNSNKNTYIQSTFELSDFANLGELRLDWTDGWACRWYEIFASDKEEDLYDKSLYEYKNLEVGNLEQIFNLYLNNVKYIGIRFYDLRKSGGTYGATVLPAEFTLTERDIKTFNIDDTWLANTLTHGYPLRPCVGANTNGYKTKAYGQGSNANGVGTKAISKGQTALGTFNKPNPDALVSVGNGTSDNDRHNAFEVLRDGRFRVNDSDYAFLPAPPITNSLRGNAVFASDVSPLEHDLDIKISSDTIEDLSGITLSQFGKNLLPIGKDYWERGVGDFTFDEEGVYGKYGSGASDFTMCATKYPSGTYSFSAEFSYKGENGNSKSRILARCFDAEGNILTSVYSNYNAFYKAFILPLDDVLTFTIPDTVAYWQFGWVAMEVAIGNPSSMKFPQLERGDNVTPYEPCVVHTATANADGIVEGLKSVSPNMTLIPDTDNVVIEVEYIADTKLYIDNKFKELKSELQALILEG